MHIMQYVGKAETTFNVRLNNHRKDTKKPNSILACKNIFTRKDIISTNIPNSSSLTNINLHDSKEALREMLVIRENFWIQKLRTLVPFGRNQELSK